MPDVIYFGSPTAAVYREVLERWRPAKLDDVELRVWGAHREWHNGHSMCEQRFGQEFLIRYLEVGTITRPLVHHLREEIGYCLDAPELIPAGSCAGEEFDGQQFPMLTMILREEEQCPTPQHPELDEAIVPVSPD